MDMYTAHLVGSELMKEWLRQADMVRRHQPRSEADQSSGSREASQPSTIRPGGRIDARGPGRRRRLRARMRRRP